jgi:hypothetical protein
MGGSGCFFVPDAPDYLNHFYQSFRRMKQQVNPAGRDSQRAAFNLCVGNSRKRSPTRKNQTFPSPSHSEIHNLHRKMREPEGLMA